MHPWPHPVQYQRNTLYAAGVFAVMVVLLIISIAIDTPRWYEWVANVIFIVVTPSVPIAIGIAILRYRLYDIDLLGPVVI
jgi:hypothetical protein